MSFYFIFFDRAKVSGYILSINKMKILIVVFVLLIVVIYQSTVVYAPVV